MSRGVVLAASMGLLLAACTGNPPIDQPDPAPRRISVGWIGHEWRTCDEDGTCRKPTPKTIALPTPEPMPARPAAQVRPQSSAVERQPVIVHFEFASATPTKAGATALGEALAQIRAGDSIQIDGHTDDLGAVAFNDRLARRRAEFVATWLRRHGVKNPTQIEAHGKCCYVAPNDSDKGRAANRRVEIHFATTQKENVR